MYRYIIHLALAMACAVGCVTEASAAKQPKFAYTDDNPLVVAFSEDFPPYEFLNVKGDPDGYVCEILKIVFDQIHVKYRLEVAENRECSRNFLAGKSQLMATPMVENLPGFYYTKVSLAPFRRGVAYRRNETKVSRMADFKPTDRIGLKEKAFKNERIIQEKLFNPGQLSYSSIKDGLYEVDKGSLDYFIAGETTMKWIVGRYHLDNVAVGDIDAPSAQVRLVSRDKLLIEAFDNAFTELQMSGEANKIYRKWANMEEETPVVNRRTVYSIVGALLVIICIVIVHIVVRRRIRKRMQVMLDINSIMDKALAIGDCYVLYTDMKHGKRVSNFYGNLLPPEGLSKEEDLMHIHPDDRPSVYLVYKQILEQPDKVHEFKYHWNKGSEANPHWITLLGRSIVECDKRGDIVSIITTCSDITKAEQQHEVTKSTSAVYGRVFEIPFVGLALYDPQGNLIQANQEMRRLLHDEGVKPDLFVETNLFDFPAVRGCVDRDNVEPFFVCTRTDINVDGQNNYMEFSLQPVSDDKNVLLYIMVTAVDMTETRRVNLQSKVHDNEVKRVGTEIRRYESELRYLLEDSRMAAWKSNFKKRTVTFFKDLRTYECRYTFDELLSEVSESDREEMMEIVSSRESGDMGSTSTVKSAIDYGYGSNEERWISFHSIAVKDSEGNVTGRFGLVRDVSVQMETQLSMMREKDRANDSGRLKSVFLANMSHEIRTPLNAIVGFCDLIQAVDEEERAEFIKIIHNNCHLLLQIINDILVISEVDTDGLSIQLTTFNFAEVFDIICSSLSQRVTDTNVEMYKDNPYKECIVTMDQGRIEQVITNFLTNAVKHTKMGYIKLGYRKQDDGIYIYCEDTGSGIPKDKCTKIFDRFVKLNDYVQGAGLGLSICKAIADKFHGKIGVDSEVGKGSTFWIWVPTNVQVTKRDDVTEGSTPPPQRIKSVSNTKTLKEM